MVVEMSKKIIIIGLIILVVIGIYTSGILKGNEEQHILISDNSNNPIVTINLTGKWLPMEYGRYDEHNTENSFTYIKAFNLNDTKQKEYFTEIVNICKDSSKIHDNKYGDYYKIGTEKELQQKMIHTFYDNGLRIKTTNFYVAYTSDEATNTAVVIYTTAGALAPELINKVQFHKTNDHVVLT